MICVVLDHIGDPRSRLLFIIVSPPRSILRPNSKTLLRPLYGSQRTTAKQGRLSRREPIGSNNRRTVSASRRRRSSDGGGEWLQSGGDRRRRRGSGRCRSCHRPRGCWALAIATPISQCPHQHPLRRSISDAGMASSRQRPVHRHDEVSRRAW